jgi:hypothetical protein
MKLMQKKIKVCFRNSTFDALCQYDEMNKYLCVGYMEKFQTRLLNVTDQKNHSNPPS